MKKLFTIAALALAVMPMAAQETYENANIATEDLNIVAQFEANTGIDEIEGSNATVYSAESNIYVKGAENMNIYVYDVNGRCVCTQANATETVVFKMNTTGVYLVKVGNAPAKRVVVVR